jgi:chromosome segregation ATPase
VTKLDDYAEKWQVTVVRSELLIIWLCLLALCGTGCQTTPRAIPVVPVVTAAPRQASAKSPLIEARAAAVESSRRVEVARNNVDVSIGNVERYRDAEYAELHALVTRVKEKGSITTAELEELVTRVLAQKGQLDTLLTRLKQVQKELSVSWELRQQIDTKLTEALAKVAAKDSEADMLRQQLADQQQTSKALEQNAQVNLESAVKSQSAAAHMKGQRDLVIKVLIGVSVVAVLSLVANYLQFRRGLLPF